MQLVEQHIVKSSSPFYNECESLTFKGKNLYNSCLYVLKEAYKKDKSNLLYDLHKIMKDSEPYKELPAKVSSSVLLMVQKNYKSYFKSLAEYKKRPDKFKGIPRMPKYLDSKDGRFGVSWTNQAISKKIFKKYGKIKLSKTSIEFKTRINKFESIDCIRIIPKTGYHVIEVIYTILDTEKLADNNRYMAIDLGVNNLATLTSNKIDPLIINGKPLKSINQFYNKRLAYYKSILKTRNKKNVSKNVNKLHLKRKNKVDNYLHKSSKEIINKLIENKINTLIIGNNDGWKQDINIGNKNNQNFVSIPHSRFINMLVYKCEKEGINLVLQEESYTSQSSFLDLDKIPVYGRKSVKNEYKFSGRRIGRGLYRSKNGGIINSDVNGSYNILRKAFPKVFTDGIEGLGVNPKVIKTLKQ